MPMRRVLALAIVLLFASSAPAIAQTASCPGIFSQLGGGTFASLTITNTATLFNTLTIPSNAKCFVGVIELANVRYRDDGTAPTTGVAGGTNGAAGTLVTSGTQVIIPMNSFNTLQLISTTSTSAVLQGNFYK